VGAQIIDQGIDVFMLRGQLLIYLFKEVHVGGKMTAEATAPTCGEAVVRPLFNSANASPSAILKALTIGPSPLWFRLLARCELTCMHGSSLLALRHLLACATLVEDAHDLDQQGDVIVVSHTY
jgi:hypothetical protein